jgi:hypothetical protein
MKALCLEVKFQKIGNRIKYKLPVKMFCERMNTEIPNSMTLDKTDALIINWLGKNVDSLFKKTKIIYKKVNINQAYDSCDKPRGGRNVLQM